MTVCYAVVDWLSTITGVEDDIPLKAAIKLVFEPFYVLKPLIP